MDSCCKIGDSASLLGGGIVAGDLIIAGDLTVQGDFNFGTVSTDLFTANGESLFLAPVTVRGDDANMFLVEKADGTDMFKINTSTSRINLGVPTETASSIAVGGRYIMGSTYNFSYPAFAPGPDTGGSFRRIGMWGGLSNNTIFTTNAGLSANFSIGDMTHPTTHWFSANDTLAERGMAWHDGTNFNIGVNTGGLKINTRLKTSQGSDVASANNLVLGTDGNTFEITGTTQINLLDNTGWDNGDIVHLHFTASPTIKHAQATSGANTTILLAGSADFSATANDNLTLQLREVGGTQAWVELSRTVI